MGDLARADLVGGGQLLRLEKARDPTQRLGGFAVADGDCLSSNGGWLAIGRSSGDGVNCQRAQAAGRTDQASVRSLELVDLADVSLYLLGLVVQPRWRIGDLRFLARLGTALLGGADAVATIALVLVWPAMAFVVALLVVHLVVALAMTGHSLAREKRWRLHTIPGLPLIFATVLAYLTFQGMTGWPI